MTMISRRGFLGSSAIVAGAAIFAPRSVFAQEGQQPELMLFARKIASTAKITTQKLRGGMYALLGTAGNIAVLPGPQGKLLVDSGMATAQPQIVEALTAISADKLSHLINTHWHYDHTDGNSWMHEAGAIIIAQEKCKARLSSTQTIKAFNATFPPVSKGALPTKTFGEKYQIKLNGMTISMAHYESAHTDTDISIHFVEADVLHVGDTWLNGFYPFIDYSSGGNINGMIKAADRTLAMAGADTIIIPGHGPVGNKKQLQEFRDVLAFARDTVAVLKQQGKTLDEVVAAKPTEKYDATWGAGFMKTDMFLGFVYQGV